MLHWVKRQGFNKEEYTDNIAHSSTCRGSSLKVTRSMFYMNFENRKERKKEKYSSNYNYSRAAVPVHATIHLQWLIKIRGVYY